MKNKGFTLIELLAVIVILAIIALIATPTILNIIGDTSKSSVEASMVNIEHAVKLYYQNKQLKEETDIVTFICNKGICKTGEEKLDITGKGPDSGTITIDKKGNILFDSIVINGYVCNKQSNQFECEQANLLKVTTEENTISINTSSTKLSNYKIEGNSVQDTSNGGPSPDNPIEVYSVGDLVTDSRDSNYGKYKISVKSTGMNLFNKDDKDVQIGRIYVDGSVNTVGVTNRMVSGFIPVKPNTTYSQLYKSASGYRVGFYDSSYSYIGDNVAQKYYFTTTDNTAYVRVTFPLEQLETYMVIEGNFSTLETMPAYEPYQDIVTTNIYIDEPLRKIGDYVDYIDFENKLLYRVIKQKQINGDNSFDRFSGVTKYSAFFLSNSDLAMKGSTTANVKLLSNKFQYHPCSIANTNDKWSNNYQIGGVVSSSYKRVSFTLPNTITTNAGVKEWFKNNPVDYFYPSATPIEQTIELPDIQTFKGTTILYVDTSIKPSKLELEYYK